MAVSLTSSKIAPQGMAQLGLSRKGPALFWTLTEGGRASASDRSTKPMRKLLTDLGYATYGWGLGRNLVFNDAREAKMNALLEETYAQHGQKVSLVGWSLGGVFAREVAKSNPDMVRSVISLGSPISGELDHSNARKLYEYFNGKPDRKMQNRLASISVAPPVPTTSIYTKTDGVVAWKGSIQRPGKTPSENICVPASHIGLGVNPLVMYALADRLAQEESQWAPFEAEGLKRFVFK